MVSLITPVNDIYIYIYISYDNDRLISQIDDRLMINLIQIIHKLVYINLFDRIYDEMIYHVECINQTNYIQIECKLDTN